MVIECRPNFGANRAIASKIQPFENVKFYKEIYGHPVAVRTQRPDMAIHFFVNFDVVKWLYLSQNSVKTGNTPCTLKNRIQSFLLFFQKYDRKLPAEFET